MPKFHVPYSDGSAIAVFAANPGEAEKHANKVEAQAAVRENRETRPVDTANIKPLKP